MWYSKSLTGLTNTLSMYVDASNLAPGPYHDHGSGAVLSVSVNGYWAQIALQANTNIYDLAITCLNDQLWTIGGNGGPLWAHCWPLTNFSGHWHTLELQLARTCNKYAQCYDYLNWYLDGTVYDSQDVGAVTFDNEVEPNVVVESFDFTASDFNTMVAQYYMQIGTSYARQTTFLYGGTYGAAVQNCHDQYQTTGVTTGGPNPEPAPSNVGVTGYYWSGQASGWSVAESGVGNINTYPISDGYPITQSYVGQDCNSYIG